MFDFLEVTEVDLETDVKRQDNRQRVFFDLEGTLSAKEGDILQLAAITTDWDFNITGVYTDYYTNVKPIGEAEFRVHQISQEFINNNAIKHFTQAVDETPLRTNKPTMFISYTTFDIRRIQEELTAYGIEPIDFGEEKSDLATSLSDGSNCYLDAFKFGKKKGVVVAKELTSQAFDDIYEELETFGSFEQKSNHDALYDTVMILALCRRYVNGGKYKPRGSTNN